MALKTITTIFPSGIFFGVETSVAGAPTVTKPAGSMVINRVDFIVYESLGGGAWIALNSGALSPAWPPPNCYYIDANITESVAGRCYTTIAAAVADIEADADTAGLTLTLYLSSDSQEYSWDGASSGLVAGSDRSYILQSLGQNEDNAVLNIQGTFVAATGSVRLQCNNLLINVDAGVDLGTGRQLVLHECDFYGNSTAVRSQGIVARDCNFTNHRFVAQAANAAWVMYDCRETSITGELATIWGGGVGLVKQGGTTNISEDNFVYFSSTAAGTAEVSGGASLRFNNSLNGASKTFDIGGGALTLAGCTFNYRSSGGGTNDLGTFAIQTGLQVSFFGTDPTNIPSGAWHVNAGAVVPVP